MPEDPNELEWNDPPPDYSWIWLAMVAGIFLIVLIAVVATVTIELSRRAGWIV